MSTSIRIEDLFLIYESSGEKFVALRGLHLDIDQGECLVVRGPNGSGKSTLVKVLTGYLAPTSGNIFIDEKNIAEIDPITLRREYVASVDQRGNLIEELSVLENLALGHQLRKIGYRESVVLAQRSLEKYGLAEIAHAYPTQISSGQRQIASLLAALATEPKILVADEPSAELDDTLAKEVYSLLKRLAGETTIILVTHDYRAEEFADRIVRIQEGRISEEWRPGQPEQSVTDPFGWKRVQDVPAPILVRDRPDLALEISPILRADDLSLEYDERKLFSHLSFSAHAGQLIAIDSTNSPGSGKSSLLRILAGIADPTSGSVKIREQEIGMLDRTGRAELRQHNVGYLDQRSSALENILLADFFGDLAIPQDQIFLQRGDQSLKSFSGGERAYIELIQLLVEAKPLLILDEPTSQMDERRTIASIAKIFDYCFAGGVVVMTTKEILVLSSADLVINPLDLHN